MDRSIFVRKPLSDIAAEARGGAGGLKQVLGPLDLADMTSIGTLLAFAMVCLAVPLLRASHPELPRPFRCPGAPWVPLLGTVVCLGLTLQLGPATWIRLVVWTAIGLGIYFGYGYRHGALAATTRTAPTPAVEPEVAPPTAPAPPTA